MSVFKNGKFYHYEFFLDGLRHRDSAGTANKPQAIQEERRQRERLEKSYSQVIEEEARDQRRKKRKGRRKEGSIVRDRRYFSCIANMVWLPTPLKRFTDALPEVKTMLRTCAFYLYDWACEAEGVRDHAESIRTGTIPSGYPQSWPCPDRPRLLPAGTAPFHATRRRRDS